MVSAGWVVVVALCAVLPLPVWSYSTAMKQEVLAQNVPKRGLVDHAREIGVEVDARRIAGAADVAERAVVGERQPTRAGIGAGNAGRGCQEIERPAAAHRHAAGNAGDQGRRRRVVFPGELQADGAVEVPQPRRADAEQRHVEQGMRDVDICAMRGDRRDPRIHAQNGGVHRAELVIDVSPLTLGVGLEPVN